MRLCAIKANACSGDLRITFSNHINQFVKIFLIGWITAESFRQLL